MYSLRRETRQKEAWTFEDELLFGPLDPRLARKLKLSYTQSIMEKMRRIQKLLKKLKTVQIKKALLRAGFEPFGDGGIFRVGNSILTLEGGGLLFQFFDSPWKGVSPAFTIAPESFTGDVVVVPVAELRAVSQRLDILESELRKQVLAVQVAHI